MSEAHKILEWAAAIVFVGVWLALYIYALRNQHKPFWYGFIHWMGP